MAILRGRKNKKEEIKVAEQIEIKDDKKENIKIENEKVEEIKTTGEENKPRKISLRKGAKVIANGRCFGASSLECPLKSVRDYETKILEIDKDKNSVLIDEGWISISNLK